MNRTWAAIAAALVIIVTGAAPAAAARPTCEPGWVYVEAPSRDGTGGQVATIEQIVDSPVDVSFTFHMWNTTLSESDGTVTVDGPVGGMFPAPVSHGHQSAVGLGTVSLDPGVVQFFVSADGRFSGCVRIEATVTPDTTTTTTTSAPSTTTSPTTTTTAPAVTSSTVPPPPDVTTTSGSPTTTSPITNSVPPTTPTVEPPERDVIKCIPTADGDYVVDWGPDAGKSCLPVTGIDTAHLVLIGFGLLAGGYWGLFVTSPHRHRR